MSAPPELIPVRMLNEQSYCPRLAYLEWVQGEFVHNADTMDGRVQHRRVDKEIGQLPDADSLDGEEKLHARSVMLSAPLLGMIAKLDLIEASGQVVTPVDYKRGRAPDVEHNAWEPERVQVCAQAMILEENGYQVERGLLYFVESKQKIPVIIDAVLRARTMELLSQLRASAASATAPPPLVDSPKCPRCSLVGICLPDETNALIKSAAADVPTTTVRRLVPSRDDALPLYVQSAGTRVGKSGEELTIETRDGEKTTVRLGDTSHLVLFGAVQVSTQALHCLLDEEVPVTYLTAGGWFKGVTRGMDHKNVELRRRQFAVAANPESSLALAKAMTAGKIRNCRTLIRRNADDAAIALLRLKEIVADVGEAQNLGSLLGFEGTAARIYFEQFAKLVAPPASEASSDDSDQQSTPANGDFRFDFNGRNRRPPKDPINALLSLGYALLAKDVTVALLAVGFDPFMGFYHQPRYGRPALALDLMEEFRPLVVDSVVLSCVNTGAVKSSDFVRRGGAVSLTQSGRGKFIRAYERRMDEEVSHPVFGYRLGYRRTIELQARLLARCLCLEIAEYPPFTTR
jgi:CRISP-associated protein Cas1